MIWAAVISAVASIIGMIVQGSQNKNLAEYQADRNEDYLHEQQAYNSPKEQMQRFSDAGLNPALIYGQGSSGNQSAPLSFPEIKAPDIQGTFSKIGQQPYEVLHAKLLQAQTQNVEAKTIESTAKSGLYEIQTQIAKNNPMLNEAAVKAMCDSFVSTATIKANEAQLSTQKTKWMLGRTTVSGDGYYSNSVNGIAMLQKQLEFMEQKFNLNEKDQKIKGEILESKEFQNAILEVQKRFMTDGDVTPQHIISFIQLLLMRLAK